jgi:hypothetical protein
MCAIRCVMITSIREVHEAKGGTIARLDDATEKVVAQIQ